MPPTPAGPWERATTLAMLGLARSPGASVELTPDQTASLPPGSPELTVLRAAATALLWRLAGERAGAGQASAPTLAPAPPLRPITETATRRLARMLTDGPRELVDEWLTLAAQSGRTLAPHWVPTLFEALAPEARATHAAVFGERIGWLAAQDPRWRLEAAVREPTDEDWASGTLPERIALLQQMRLTDPDRARSWLESTWTTEPPESREPFMGILRTNLSAADESFLEAALDDKRKTIRTAAAENLLRLPQSMYMRRVLDRLEPLFVFEARSTGLLGRFAARKLRIELPPALDKSAIRDGIEAKPPATRKIGERAWWLMQMIASVPPALWCTRFDCRAMDLLAATSSTDYADDLCSAFTAACVRHPNAEWVEALSAAWRDRVDRPEARATAIESIARLITALPVAQQDDLLLGQIDALRDARVIDVAADLLQRLDRSWSPTLTAAALDVLDRWVRAVTPPYSVPRTTLESWARRADPGTTVAAIAPLLERIPTESTWRNALERFRELIDFRTDMHKELLT